MHMALIVGGVPQACIKRSRLRKDPVPLYPLACMLPQYNIFRAVKGMARIAVTPLKAGGPCSSVMPHISFFCRLIAANPSNRPYFGPKWAHHFHFLAPACFTDFKTCRYNNKKWFRYEESPETQAYMEVPKMGKLCVIDHPLVQHKLGFIRDKHTGAKQFRELIGEVSMLMAYEVTRDMDLEEVEVETPVATCKCRKISGKKLGIVPVLRAGLGMVDGVLNLIPAAKVGHIGLYRDPETLKPVEYYCKLPPDVENRLLIVLDPMLATGGSAAAAIQFLKDRGCTSIKLMNLIAAPEGIAFVQQAHPDVDIFVAAVDERLNDHGYIVPGLGDAGDRLFGTK